MDQAYNDYQLSNKPSRIEINSFNQDQKICIEIILQKWMRQLINPYHNILESDLVLNYIYNPLDIVLNKLLHSKFHLYGPEHPAQCSFERKKLYHRPPFEKWPTNLNEVKHLFEKSEDDPLDNDESVQETAIIIQNVHDEPIYLPNENQLLTDVSENQQGVTLYHIFCRKVDVALTYSPETGLKLYLLICEAKHPDVRLKGDYNKLCRMLHDAANSFILYWVKKIRKVPEKLKKLFVKCDGLVCFQKMGNFS